LERSFSGDIVPERLDDYIAEDNPVRVIDVLVDELDLGELGFEGMEPAVTGRPAYGSIVFNPWVDALAP
jgi:transposase